MGNSQIATDSVQRLLPRKTPTQSRSSHTVDAILEAAARILEEAGFDRYTTNDIAERAGVSVGSFYQYFPNKDAVTVALIGSETEALSADVRDALRGPGDVEPLKRMIEIGVEHQLSRPRFAKLLDIEQDRLALIMPELNNAADIRFEITQFLNVKWRLRRLGSKEAAADIVRIVSALTDAAGRRGETDSRCLTSRIEGAVFGYLRSLL